MISRKQKKNKPVPKWMVDRLGEVLQAKTNLPLQKCVAESEDVCRYLVCPRHRKRLAYCPWAKN